MSEYSVHFNNMNAALESYESLLQPMLDVGEEIAQVRTALTMEIRQRHAIDTRLAGLSEKCEELETDVRRYVQQGYNILSLYQETERKALGDKASQMQWIENIPTGSLVAGTAADIRDVADIANTIYGDATEADETTKSWIEILTDAAKGAKENLEDTGTKTFLDYLQTLLDVKDKVYGSDKAAMNSSLLDYCETLVDFWSGDKKGLSGAADLCDLFSDSTSLWSSAYDYFKDVYHEAGDFFGLRGQKMVGALGIAGSVAGLGSTFLDALDDPGDNLWESASKVVDMADDGTTILSEIYSLAHINDAANVLTTKTGPWSPLSIYTSIATGAYDTVSQMLSDIGDLSSDGKWTAEDTGDVMVRGSLTGIESILSTLTFGVSDRVMDGINMMVGGEPLGDDETYAMRIAEGCKSVCTTIGTAIGNGIVKLQRKLRK